VSVGAEVERDYHIDKPAEYGAAILRDWLTNAPRVAASYDADG